MRNPLYLAVALAITGQGLLLSSPVLLVYAAVLLAAFIAFVHWYEEPSLARRFGDQYQAYRNQVVAQPAPRAAMIYQKMRQCSGAKRLAHFTQCSSSNQARMLGSASLMWSSMPLWS